MLIAEVLLEHGTLNSKETKELIWKFIEAKIEAKIPKVEHQNLEDIE